MKSCSSPEANPSEIEPWLNETLETLTHREREIILMRFFDGLSYQEIAREIGIAENTAGKRARYAIEKMRRHLLKKKVAATSAALAILLTSQRDNTAPVSCHAATLHAIHQITIVGPASMNSRFTLLFQGAFLAMQASKYQYLLASALALFLIGGVAIPIAVHLHQSRTVAAEIGCVTLTDAEAGPLRANDSVSAARAEIERDMATETNDQEHNQWKTEPWDAPHRVVIEGDRSRHTADDTLYTTMNNFGKKLDHFAKDRTASIRVMAFQLNGDQAIVTSQFTEQFVEKVQDPHFNDNKPVGSVFSGGGTEQSVWQKVSGRWMDVGPDAIPGTVHN